MEGYPLLSPCCCDLTAALSKEVDMINARRGSTILQKEIMGGIRIYCADRYAADEFEMLVISYYQKLNEERAGIVESALTGGRFHKV